MFLLVFVQNKINSIAKKYRSGGTMYGHSYIRFEFKRPEHIQNCTEQDALLYFVSSSYVFLVEITSIITN